MSKELLQLGLENISKAFVCGVYVVGGGGECCTESEIKREFYVR